MPSLKKISNSKSNRSPLNLARLSLNEEILLAGILDKPREFLIGHPQYNVPPRAARKFAQARRKLTAGWPLAYLLGFKWFFGLKFKVNPNVLIPRPETENLAERAIQAAKELKPKLIVDVGTGSGAILLALRHNLPESPAQFFGLDVSAKALAVARTNAKTLLPKNQAAKIKFARGNLLLPLAKTLKDSAQVLICANLPYLSKKELREKSIEHEPKLALFGGKDSALLITKLLIQAGALRLQNSKIFLEINYNQGAKISKLAQTCLPAAEVRVHKDLAGFDRIVEITLP